jgi:hypothetical protein
MNYVTSLPLAYIREGDNARMIEVAENCYRNEALRHLLARLGPVESPSTGPTYTREDGAPEAPSKGRGCWAAAVWLRRHGPDRDQGERRYYRSDSWVTPYTPPRPEPALFEPADIETRRKWIKVPGGRPPTRQEKRRDLSTLFSWGMSILDPPPRSGATKAATHRLADPNGIRPQHPLNTRPDKLAVKVVERIDPAYRAARIEHIEVHGHPLSAFTATPKCPAGRCSCRKPVKARPAGMAIVSDRDTGYRNPPDWECRTDFNRPNTGYRKLPDFGSPDRKGVAVGYLKSPFFTGPDWKGTPLEGTHSDPRRALGAWARHCRLSRQDERQTWAQFLATGDADARQRLVDSCASKCLAFAQHRLDRHERWDGFHVLLEEVARIVDARKFDPDKASLPAFVDKMLVWRVRDIKRRIRDREKLMVPTGLSAGLNSTPTLAPRLIRSGR